ncbi:MAG: hypothetical protein RR397_10770 [Odoribacter sp.]
MLLPAKQKYAIYSRGTGKSFINGSEVDENIRLMPRGITSLAQATYGQTLTKTLPSTFKMLEMLGYKRFDSKTGTGDYVVCRRPPEGWYLPYEHILSFEHCICFRNGHVLYMLTQDGNSRGPNTDYNITDEALTLDKQKFDEEAAPTNRANKHIFGPNGSNPVLKHNGNTFLSSMPYTPDQKWLLEPAEYYERERGVRLFDVWNRIVRLQLQLVEAAIDKDAALYKELWNECVRLRKTITPFVSEKGVLFILGSIFDNIANIGMSYIINMYNLMDKLTFMIEILNYYVDKIDSCYYQLDERHIYYNATNDSFIRDFAEDNEFDWKKMANNDDSRRDLDCDPNKPLEITPDWGSAAAFLEVGQVRNYDYVTKTFSRRPVDCNINEFFVKRDDVSDTMINALVDKFCHYYRNHPKKNVVYFRDKYGDIKQANSKKTYNEIAIDRLTKNNWKVEQRTHRGIEPPQHDKYLLWAAILAETDERYPLKRFNGSKCKYTLISMNNTRVMEDSRGKFAKDKRSERNKSILPEEATHFGDAVDKRVWTKYGDLLVRAGSFVDARM